MDALDLAARGLRHRADAAEPALRLPRRAARHRDRRAARHRPGHDDRAAAAAHLRRWTSPARCIMFAGIYYGGMYGGSTTSILLNTPGESASVVTAIEGNKMAKAGRAAAGPGDRGHRLLRRRHHRAPSALALLAPDGRRARRAGLGAPTSSRSWCSPSSRSRRCSAAPGSAGWPSLGIGLTIGLIGIDPTSGQQRLTFGIPELADGIDVVVVAVGLFAVGEALWVGGPPAPHAGRGHPRRQPADEPRRTGRRSWKPWLRGTAIGFPFGADPRRWRRDPDLPLLRHGEAALQAPRGVRQGCHRGRRGPGGDQQRLGRRWPRADAHPGHPDDGHRGDHAGAPSRATASSPARSCSTTSRSWSGA